MYQIALGQRYSPNDIVPVLTTDASNTPNYEIHAGTVSIPDSSKRIAVIGMTTVDAVDYIKNNFAKGEGIHYMSRQQISLCNKYTDNIPTTFYPLSIKDTNRCRGMRGLDKIYADARTPIGIVSNFYLFMLREASFKNIELFNTNRL